MRKDDSMKLNNPNLDIIPSVALADSIYDDQDLKLTIAENMHTYGGSFVKALSECVLRADRQNFSKLVDAFREYFLQYQPNNWRNK